ncbi:DUF192 domain-containing protein [Patescibacteria group bacterium]|nr:DUF192 domain-containing protein [Patescibacteria group bacterium]MBU1034382.1 DUF192 domain-containing protein [Patescibacteria group bacterium]MBU1629766.1 DUF192 domain-containing protein [Patescibacteria group bacterium]MBU1907928.1 DUF192 domain-containing protein [Patescibacteria group bacterium]
MALALRRKIIALACVLAATAGFAVALAAFSKSPQPEKTAIVDLTDWQLEIASTDAARKQGLGGRSPLAPKNGMLFVFDEAGFYPFWMKDMTFALDIVWVNGNKVVEVASLEPPLVTNPNPAAHIPTHRADSVLEINAGQASALGLTPGIFVILP